VNTELVVFAALIAAGFMLLGLGLVFSGNKDLFSFILALAAAILYFSESSAYIQWLGDYHKYTRLLFLSLTVLIGGCLLFWVGAKTARKPLTIASASVL